MSFLLSRRPFVVLCYADSARSPLVYTQWVNALMADGFRPIQRGETEAHMHGREGDTLTISHAASYIIGVRGIDASDIVHALTQK